MVSLIGRLRKEKEDVFVVTGERNDRRKRCQGVFQEYRFDYESSSIVHVMESVQPDWIIFAVSLDDVKGMQWEQKAMHYIAGLTNVLISARRVGIKKILYISSVSGFLEEKDAMVRLGQEVCENFKQEEGQQIFTVRMGELYGGYKKEVIGDSICTELCKRVLHQKPQAENKEKPHNLLYVEDAVDGLFRILHRENGERKNCNLNGSRDYTEEEIYQTVARIAAGNMRSRMETEEKGIGVKRDCEDQKAFGFSEKYGLEEGIKHLYDALCSSDLSDSDMDHRGGEKRKKSFRIRMTEKTKLFPFFENIIAFALLQLFVTFTNGVAFHATIDVYLLYIILFGVTYGMVQAVFSVILSVIGRFHIMISTQGILMLFQEYDKYLWILQIFIIGIVVGFLKDKYKRKTEDYAEEEEYLRAELENLTEINKSNMVVKSIYEGRLLGYKDSFVNVYEVVSQLDDMESYKVIFNTVSVISGLVGSKDVALYMCDKYEKYARLIAASSEYGREKGKSIELNRFQEMHDRLKNQEIYTNRALSSEYPVMAGGTYDAGGLKMIIAIWTLPYENNNLNQANTFSIACKLVDRTLARAYRYMESISRDTYIDATCIMMKEPFANILNLYSYGFEKGYLRYSVVKITGYSMDQNEFYDKIRTSIRDTDYAGEGEDGGVRLLLTNTDQEEAAFVLERLYSRQIEAELLPMVSVGAVTSDKMVV